MDIILKYFPELTMSQKTGFEALGNLYNYWNERINVISRKDIASLYTHHVLHSLSIAKVIQFKPGCQILDIGTGGGFPGIPLAILFPEVHFTLVDSIGKKIQVVKEVANSMKLKNVAAINARAETIPGTFDFVVSRAVTNLETIIAWIKFKIKKECFNELENGLLYLKGGDFFDELKALNKPYKIYKLQDYFNEDFFATKKLVHIKLI